MPIDWLALGGFFVTALWDPVTQLVVVLAFLGLLYKGVEIADKKYGR